VYVIFRQCCANYDYPGESDNFILYSVSDLMPLKRSTYSSTVTFIDDSLIYVQHHNSDVNFYSYKVKNNAENIMQPSINVLT